jgi:hypothetical protein
LFLKESFDPEILNVVYLHTKQSDVDMLDLILDVDESKYSNVLYVFQLVPVIVRVPSKREILGKPSGKK